MTERERERERDREKGKERDRVRPPPPPPRSDPFIWIPGFRSLFIQDKRGGIQEERRNSRTDLASGAV